MWITSSTHVVFIFTLALSVKSSPLFEERATSRCTARNLAIVERTVIDPVYFCKWWQEDTRTRTPFLEFTVSEVNDLCACIAPESSAKPTKHKRVPVDGFVPIAKRSPTTDACRTEVSTQFTEPWHFCAFYNAYPRHSSPFRKYATKDLIKLCNCVQRKSGSISQKTSATTKKTSTFTKATSKITTTPSSSKIGKSSSGTRRVSLSTKKTTTSTGKTMTATKKTSRSNTKSFSSSVRKSSSNTTKPSPSAIRKSSSSTTKSSSSRIGNPSTSATKYLSSEAHRTSTSARKSSSLSTERSSTSISKPSSSSIQRSSTSTSKKPASTSPSISVGHCVPKAPRYPGGYGYLEEDWNYSRMDNKNCRVQAPSNVQPPQSDVLAIHQIFPYIGNCAQLCLETNACESWSLDSTHTVCTLYNTMIAKYIEILQSPGDDSDDVPETNVYYNANCYTCADTIGYLACNELSRSPPSGSSCGTLGLSLANARVASYSSQESRCGALEGRDSECALLCMVDLNCSSFSKDQDTQLCFFYNQTASVIANQYRGNTTDQSLYDVQCWRGSDFGGECGCQI